jgi:hypothetical protein
MKNELFKFWAGGWKAYEEAEKRSQQPNVPSSFFGRMMKIGRAILMPWDRKIDKRLF